MLPEHLASSYERYKANTDYVVNWLATNAAKCGYTLKGDGMSGPSTVNRPRLKGKARKLAREATAASRCASQESLTHHVRMDEFVPLAQCIAHSKTIKPDTSCFSYALREAIRDRQRHQKWYSTHAGPQHGSDGHGYFITVLENVQQIVCPTQPARESKVGRNTLPEKVDYGNGLMNQFEGLTVEDPQDFAQCDDAQYESSIHAPREFGADLSTSKDEAFRASIELWIDVHSMRMTIRRVWQMYLAGEQDLAAASITSNTAIDFVRSLQENFDDTFRGQHRLEGDVCPVCAFQVDAVGEKADFTDGICLDSAHLIVRHLAKFWKEDTSDYVPTVNPALTDLYPLGTGQMDTARRAHHDFKLAMGVIPEYSVLNMVDSPAQAEHEIMRGLRELKRHQSPIFWLSFALQIYLDIRNVLRFNVSRAFDNMRREAAQITQNIKRVLDFHQQKTWRLDDRSLREVLDLLDRWTQQDVIGSIRKSRLSNENAASHLTDYYLLKLSDGCV